MDLFVLGLDWIGSPVNYRDKERGHLGVNARPAIQITHRARMRARRAWAQLNFRSPEKLHQKWRSNLLGDPYVRGRRLRGQKGILNYAIFSAFLGDMGVPPGRARVCRIRLDKPYGPGNCIWIEPEHLRRGTTPLDAPRAVKAHVLLMLNWDVSAIAHALNTGRQAVHDLKRGRSFRDEKVEALKLMMPDLFGE